MDARDRQIHGAELVGWGLLSIALGSVPLLIVSGVLPSSPADAEAPAWVGGGAGLVFVLGGLAMIVQALGHAAPGSGELPPTAPAWMRQLHGVLALAMVCGLAAIGSWIAFAPGEREFGVSGGLIEGPANVLIGRAIFGIGSIVTWLFAALMAARLLRGR